MSELVEDDDSDFENPSAYPPSIQAGIPKLGETPKGWKRYRLGDLLRRVERPARLVNSETYQLVTAKRNRGGIVARETLRGEQIRTKTQFYVEAGDFLISNRQISHGACGVVPESLHGAVVSNEYTAFHTSEALDPSFLNALSHSVYFQQTCFHSSIGVHVEKLVFRLEDWMGWKFDIPPLEHQKRIVSVLQAWEQAIEKTERLVEAKRKRKTAVVGKALFGSNAKRGFIRDLADINPRNTRVDAGTQVSFVAMEDVSETGALLRRTDRLRGELGNGYTQFQHGDILVAKITPCFENGKGALAHGLANGIGFGTTEFHVIRPHNPADADFLHQITLMRSFRASGERQMSGSAGQKRVPAEFIEDFPILLIGDNARRSIGSLLAALDAEVASLEGQVANFRQQRRGLMQKLLTGEWQLGEQFQ
ncbi:MAG: restriction endonuclease subunit S [Microcystis sp. LE19-4.1E]|nr:restriction endonuclease subunit S [Microcystis sp. LE19-4.1E]